MLFYTVNVRTYFEDFDEMLAISTYFKQLTITKQKTAESKSFCRRILHVFLLYLQHLLRRVLLEFNHQQRQRNKTDYGQRYLPFEIQRNGHAQNERGRRMQDDFDRLSTRLNHMMEKAQPKKTGHDTNPLNPSGVRGQFRTEGARFVF